MKDKKLIQCILLSLCVVSMGILYSCQRKEESIDIHSLTTEKIHSTEETVDNDESITIMESPPTQDDIYVHICGAIKVPDVYKISPDTRLVDLIKLAGGFTENAAEDSINQASVLYDGQQIYISSLEEIELGLTQRVDSMIDRNKVDKDKININKATKDELMTLTGIGEAKAISIIEYRERNGEFKKIEDIMNISGIKNSAFEKISDKITVK